MKTGEACKVATAAKQYWWRAGTIGREGTRDGVGRADGLGNRSVIEGWSLESMKLRLFTRRNATAECSSVQWAQSCVELAGGIGWSR